MKKTSCNNLKFLIKKTKISELPLLKRQCVNIDTLIVTENMKQKKE